MSATYSGDPGASDRDELRFVLGDTDVANALFEDEELDYLLQEHATVLEAAVAAAEILANRFAREADVAVGDLRADLASLSERWHNRALELRRKLTVRAARPQVASTRESMFKVDQWTFDGGRGLDRTEE